MKQSWKRLLLVIYGSITILLLSAGCSKEHDGEALQEVVAGLGRDAGGVYGYAHHLQPLTRVFETLVSYGYNNEIIPQLAVSWDVSKDGLIWTFHLRKDVLFHDGTPFNSQAAQFSLEMHNKKHPGHCGDIVAIKSIDEYRLQIIHRKPFAPLLYELGWFLFSMAAPSAFDEDGNITKAVGTGPFKSDTWIPDEQLILVRNNEYWGKRPKLEKITLKKIPDPATRIMALQAGAIDMIIDSGGVLPDDIAPLSRDPDIRVLQSPQCMSHYLVLNCAIPPFNDPDIRRAMLYAVDKQAIVKDLLGVGKIASSIIPSSVSDWYYPSCKTSYDPEHAGELLEQSGWRDNNGDGFLEKDGKMFYVKILLTTQQVSMGPNKMVTEHVQEKLRILGIRSDIQVLEKGAYYDAASNGKNHHILLGAYPFLGPHNVLYRSFHSEGDWNLRGNFYYNPNMNRLLEQAEHTMDNMERKKLYDEVQKLSCEDAVIIPLYEAVLINAVRSDVHGYKLHPWFVVNWEDIYVAPSHSANDASRNANRK